MKIKKNVLIPCIVIICMLGYILFSRATIEGHAWKLYVAQHAEYMHYVAHREDYAHKDNDPFFQTSKPVELILEAKDGKLILTDKTNEKTYEGIYVANSWLQVRYKSYTVQIEGLEGRANITSIPGRTLMLSIGDYVLYFTDE